MNGIEQRFNFVYDNGGRRERLKYFKGGAPTPVTETKYQFNTANMLENIQHLQGANILENLIYGYDANGNRTSMNRPSVTLPLPNPASNTSYNEANQMLTFNDKNIVYDNNGNMTSVTNACGTTTYTWNARNQLAGINGFKPDCSSLTASFNYDSLNRRIEKTINGLTTKYRYDGADIIQELNQDGSVKANYIRGLNIDEPLLRSMQNAVRFYLTDALGSVIALTDENGIVKTTYSYDPFGNTTISGEASDNPFQYTGRENDGTGLYYYRARYYSPELQRFISEDPIGFEGGDVNLYVYAGNNPVNRIDPFGLEIIYNNYKISDYRVHIALISLDSALPYSDIIVTGGDRYIDNDGKIRSSSNNQLIPHSVPNSTHLYGIAVDFKISNMTPTKEFISNYFDYVKNDYSDNHIHGDIRKQAGYGMQPML